MASVLRGAAWTTVRIGAPRHDLARGSQRQGKESRRNLRGI